MPAQAIVSTDERTMLLRFIDQQRDGIRNAALGLDDDQARLTPTTSTLSIGGLVKHVATTEQGWIDLVVGRTSAGGEEAYEAGFALGADETLDGALAALDEVARETERAIASVGLDDEVPVPKGVPWYPQDLDAWTVRWVLAHLIEEIARHAGHADIIRESIDGATMYPLLAAAEGWPATPWLQPWTPTT
jgi:uncharacterized damage-inducible protein DinB